MSGLEALSLACNILQLTDAAGQAISFCKKVYDGSTPDAHLTTTASTLKALSDEIYKDSRVVQTAPSKRRLCDLAKKCNKAARALEDETKFLSEHQAKGNLRATLALATMSNWRKKRLERFEKELQAHQRLLDSQILANVCTQGEATKAQQASDFAKLDHAMQKLIAGIAAGEKSQSELFRTHAQGINVHVTQEANRVTDVVTDAVETTVASAQGALESHITESISTLKITQEENWRQAVTHEQQQRLLRSLKFPGMYARQNMLKKPAEDTYEWIFRGHNVEYDTDYDSGESSSDSWRETPSDRSSEILSASDTTSGGNVESQKPWDDFDEWLKSDSQLYWVSGKPGSGKSTLMKFLAEHSQTIESLSTWQQSCQVITYYFWKPGSSLQHSLRGLRFTLLHQLLSKNEALLDQLCTTSQFCDEPEDWASSSLDQALFIVLASQPTSVCIFLDGLDEICIEDGPAEVLRYLPRLYGLPKVKLCASSRPEWAFESQLGREQHLRLQDLTSQDMQVAAQRALDPYKSQRNEKHFYQFDDLIDSVCRKAEGVFLWLELALRDLITGFINGDSYDELGERLDHLPSELEDLYWDMWSRLNGTSSARIYHQTAAEMFRMILAFADFRPPRHATFPTLLELHLAIQPGSLPHDGIATNLTCDEAQLIDWEKVDRDVHTKSGGLLQTWGATDLFPLPQTRKRYFPQSASPFYKEVGFIHRSAYDFLTETPNGQKILSYNTLDFNSARIRLILARVALVHFNIGYLAPLLVDLSDFERQTYYYKYSDDFVKAIDYLGVSNPRVSKSEQERIANRILYILFFREHIIRPWSQLIPGVVMKKLCTIGADLNFPQRPSGDLGTFTTGTAGPAHLSARVLGLCYLFEVDSRLYYSEDSAYNREDFITETMDICLGGMNILELQARTYLVVPMHEFQWPNLNQLSEKMTLHILKGSSFNPQVPQLFIEVNIAFIIQVLLSKISSPPPANWETLLSQCHPHLDVRYYSKHINGDSPIPTTWPFQLWGPISDAASFELSTVLMALYTSKENDDVSSLLKSGRHLMEQVEASEVIERHDFRDFSRRNLELLSRVCKGLGLDEEKYLKSWLTENYWRL
ncbi:hypothetical protein CC79DRAFT_1400618 [Sarocladium strictum]